MAPYEAHEPTGTRRRSTSGSPDGAPEIVLAGYYDFVPLARGNGSIVYRARQTGVDRHVAVKVLLEYDPEAVARFRREIDITVRLGRQHPHIVTVIDTGETSEGQLCIVMEYYDLGSLHDRVRAQGRLAPDEVIAAGAIVADALSFAHRHGVLHRDIKPQNILVLPTSYVVADFGIARQIDAARTTSVEWFSYKHAAPQVLDGEPPAVADDIWSVGSTLFTLLDGKPPFAADDPADDTALAYMRRARTSAPRPLRAPNVPPGLAAVIHRCLRKNRAERFPNAASLQAALNALSAEARAWAPERTGPTGRTGLTGPTSRPAAANTPLSPSAMAHVVASAVDAGGHKHAVSAPPSYVEPLADPDEPPRRRWFGKVAVGALLAVVVGAMLGIAGTWGIRFVGGTATPTGTTSDPAGGRPVGTLTGPPPTSLVQSKEDPSLAPSISTLRLQGTRARLAWTDPSRGKATFAVIRVVGNDGQAVWQLPPGVTEYTVENLDPDEAPYCFKIMAFVDRRYAQSSVRCTSDG